MLWWEAYGGGMGCALTISCAFFGALTGSNVSTAVTMGTVMVPPLVQAGYGKRFCAGLTCASSSLGEFIPPSIAAIIYGTVVQVSVAKVFMASLLPGIILIGLLAIPTLLIARARNYGATIKMTWPERGRILLKGAPAMVIPFIILGGIYLGVFTPTEAAAVACLASFLIGYLVYRGLTLDKVVQTLKRSIVTTANTFFVIAACTMLGAVLTYAQVPQNLMNTMLAWGITSMSFMLMAVVILFIMGMFMTPGAMILVSMPVFLPLMHQLGINVYVFYVIIVGMVGIAAVTPPVAIILFVTSDLVQEQPLPVFLETIPWLAMIVVAILLTVFFPALATYIPSRM